MNILFVSSKTGWGGIMSWMIQSSEGLQEMGHKVWIISNPKSRLVKKNYPNLNIIEKAFGPDYNPIFILWLITFIKQNSIDLIISNIRKEMIVSGYAARITGIVHLRSIGSHEDLNPRVKYIHEKLITHSIIPCKYVVDKAAKTEEWIDENKFTVIYNGRNLIAPSINEINKIRKSWSISKNELVIGITVKLSPIKNVAGLIDAFHILTKTYDNLKLVVTGFGEEEEKLKNMGSNLKLDKKIIFNGFTKNPQLIASCYDIAVLNSLSEGFPNSIVEYMSVGTATVSTNVGGIDEIIQDNVNGIFALTNNPIDLADKISLLISDSNLRERIGKNAKKTVKESFSKNKMITDLDKLFRFIIKHV